MFAAGFSNGAFMTNRLGAELPDILAGIAVAEGAVGMRPPANEPDGPFIVLSPPSGPVAAVLFHGTSDMTVKYDGGKGTGRLDALPVADEVRYWTAANHCRGPRTTTTNGTVTTDAYAGCMANSDVVFHTIAGGTHVWPTASSGISATDAAWAFFAAHSRTA